MFNDIQLAVGGSLLNQKKWSPQLQASLWDRAALYNLRHMSHASNDDSVADVFDGDDKDLSHISHKQCSIILHHSTYNPTYTIHPALFRFPSPLPLSVAPTTTKTWTAFQSWWSCWTPIPQADSLGFHQWRIPNSWMIYDGKSMKIVRTFIVENPRMMWGQPHFRNPPLGTSRQQNRLKHVDWNLETKEMGIGNRKAS